jgi:hypothetical protein
MKSPLFGGVFSRRRLISLLLAVAPAGLIAAASMADSQQGGSSSSTRRDMPESGGGEPQGAAPLPVCPVCGGTGKTLVCLTSMPPQFRTEPCHFCQGYAAGGEAVTAGTFGDTAAITVQATGRVQPAFLTVSSDGVPVWRSLSDADPSRPV